MPWFKRDNSEGITHVGADGKVYAGRGPEAKAGKGRPADEPVDSTGSSRLSSPSKAGYTYQEPAGANDMAKELRLRLLEQQYAHFGHPPGYDPDWAKKENFTTWDEYWAREGVKTKQGFFGHESDAEHLANLLLKSNPHMTKPEAARWLHPDKMPPNLKQQANDALAILNTKIADRDKRNKKRM
jgi:hypothetical protein